MVYFCVQRILLFNIQSFSLCILLLMTPYSIVDELCTNFQFYFIYTSHLNAKQVTHN